jgi:hypothetical protein
MPDENVVQVLVSRHVIDSERPFSTVLDGIYGGISRPDVRALFGMLAASTSYEQFSALVEQAKGSAGLIRFLQLDLDAALTLDPEATGSARGRLVRLIAGNPVTMGEMTRHVPDAGSYARSRSSSKSCPRGAPGSPTTQSPALSPPTTTPPPRRLPGGSTLRSSACSGARPVRPPPPERASRPAR